MVHVSTVSETIPLPSFKGSWLMRILGIHVSCVLHKVVTSPTPLRFRLPPPSSPFLCRSILRARVIICLPDMDQVVVQIGQAHQALAPRTRQLNSTLRALLRYADRSGEWRPSDEVPLVEDLGYTKRVSKKWRYNCSCDRAGQAETLG